MTDANPYDPPATTDADTRDPLATMDADTSQRFRILCITMFWLSTVFAAFSLISAILVGVQNYLTMEAMGGTLPTYIPLVVVLSVCCSFVFAWSARKWRSRLIRPALVSFIASLLFFVVGPYILLMLLYGHPTSLR